MKPTVRKIAEDLGLSSATVSKALSGRQEISSETRARVTAYANELGYLKSTANRRRLGILTVNAPDMDESQSSLMFNLMVNFQKYASRLQYDVIIVTIGFEEQKRETLDHFAYANNFDGLFIAGLKTTDPYYQQLETTTTPIVAMDIHVANPLVGNVGTNSISGGELAIRHLAELGHKRIGLLNGHSEAYISQERLAGYMAALYMHKIHFDPDLCYDGDYSLESGAKAADYFAKTDATAIYCASDLMAQGVIQRFMELGFNLPQDYSIVGFDNMSLCLGCMPTITTIAQNPADLGEAACAVLYGLTQKIPIRNVKLEPYLVVRESTAPPRG